MHPERRTCAAGPADPAEPVLDLTATRRREDLVLAVADVLLACADRPADRG
jgi:hypothetical protein